MSDLLKPEWGSGPWQDEPDQEFWLDSETDLPCLLWRNNGGAWCGYVGVPKDHSASGLSYYIPIQNGDATKRLSAQEAINNIEVHGGLTFAGSRKNMVPERYKDWHFFGFDCAHAGDYSPKYESICSIFRLGEPTGWGGVIEYRNLAYAKAECTSLAQQLNSIR